MAPLETKGGYAPEYEDKVDARIKLANVLAKNLTLSTQVRKVPGVLVFLDQEGLLSQISGVEFPLHVKKTWRKVSPH